jgi:hypothetical protein
VTTAIIGVGIRAVRSRSTFSGPARKLHSPRWTSLHLKRSQRSWDPSHAPTRWMARSLELTLSFSLCGWSKWRS